jgi:mono/diheme cytochrome c family protein
MTRPAVSATVPPNTVPFPLSVRFLQEGWKILCFRSGRYRADLAKDARWNRGAYLVRALSDCGGCHTPRNVLGGEKLRDAYAGTVVDNWIAPPLTEVNPSPVPWTQEELICRGIFFKAQKGTSRRRQLSRQENQKHGTAE